MIREIRDDFDLEKIYLSGQCFRMRGYEDGGYRLINGEHVLYLRRTGDAKYALSCGEEEWRDIWYPYFDLGRDYGGIRRAEHGKNALADRAMDYGAGIRVLRQDPWETLVTFLISQRKNLPAISKAVEALSAAYGHPIKTPYETICSFPAPEDLAGATEENLRELGMGYRAPYLLDAAQKVSQGSLDLDHLCACDDEALLEALESVRGVGVKVASCVALFAYARTSCVPVDVWIERAIREDCQGESPFDLFGEDAGILQQYIFFYKKWEGNQ